jgi:hypothetical protein
MDRTAILESAAYVGLRDFEAVLARLEGATGAPDAIDALSARVSRETDVIAATEGLEARLGKPAARAVYLCAALAQVPAARARRAAEGISEPDTQRTLADLALWAKQFRKQTGALGITPEILDWSQRYLRGGLVRLGSIQFDLIGFPGNVRAYRNDASRELAVVSLEDGRELDPRRGVPLGPARDFSNGWSLALQPGDPILDMHIPADADLDSLAITHSVDQAFEHFAERFPASRPVGTCGEAWLFDPGLEGLMRNTGVAFILQVTTRYPSAIPEERTIHRLFGPDVSRADLAGLPREAMSSLQRALADLLSRPGAALRAKGAFILKEELAPLVR